MENLFESGLWKNHGRAGLKSIVVVARAGPIGKMITRLGVAGGSSLQFFQNCRARENAKRSGKEKTMHWKKWNGKDGQVCWCGFPLYSGREYVFSKEAIGPFCSKECLREYEAAAKEKLAGFYGSQTGYL